MMAVREAPCGRQGRNSILIHPGHQRSVPLSLEPRPVYLFLSPQRQGRKAHSRGGGLARTAPRALAACAP